MIRASMKTIVGIVALSLGACDVSQQTNESSNETINAAREAAREMHNEMSANMTDDETEMDMGMDMDGMSKGNMQSGGSTNAMAPADKNSMNSSMPMDDSGHM
jgi:hypothetical protein